MFFFYFKVVLQSHFVLFYFLLGKNNFKIYPEYLRVLATDVQQQLFQISNLKPEACFLIEKQESVVRNGGREQILNLLLMGEESQNFAPSLIIPILGLAGTGKTSLTWLVYHDPIVETTFDHRLWVDVSGLQSPESLFERIDEALQADTLFDDCNNYFDSRKKFFGGKFMLVLDGLSDNDPRKWSYLLGPFLFIAIDCKPGSKILVTSRCTSLEPDLFSPLPIAKNAPYMLSLPTAKEHQEMFLNIAFSKIEEKDRAPNLIDIAHKIFKECAHNQLTIRTIAFILSSYPNLEKWQHVYDILLLSSENLHASIKSVIYLIQDSLPKYTRSLVLLPSLFPLDYIFYDLAQLQQLWEVQGFLDLMPPAKSFKNFFRRLLKVEYFIEEGESDKRGLMLYKVQVLKHEVVKHLVGDHYRFMCNPTEKVDHQKILHVSFMVDSYWKAPSWLRDAKQLKTLLFLPYQSCGLIVIPELNEILETLKGLQALDLAIVNCKSCLTSVGKLKHLRYLRLGVSFELLPNHLTDFPFLRTLDLRRSGILQLPKDFCTLSNSLRHLYVGDKLTDLPPRFADFSKLETLDVFIVGKNNGLDTLAHFTKLVGTLKIRYQQGRDHHKLPENDKILAKMTLDNLSLVWKSLNADPDVITHQEEVVELEFLQTPPTVKKLGSSRLDGNKFSELGYGTKILIHPQ